MLIGLQVVTDAPGPHEPKTVMRVKKDQVYNSAAVPQGSANSAFAGGIRSEP